MTTVSPITFIPSVRGDSSGPRARLAVIAMALALAASALVPAGAAAAPPPREFMGVSSGWSVLSDTDFARLRGSNVHIYRMELLWKDVERRRDAPYDWRHYDRLFRLAGRNDIRIIPMLHGSPGWASPNQRHQPRTPGSRRAFQEFAAAAARRYGPRGSLWSKAPWSPSSPAPTRVRAVYWQVWNEPNWAANWYPRPSPNAYGEMLRGVGRSIKAASPGSKIMAAGLFWPASGINAMSPESYLAGMLKVPGLLSTVDIFAFHPYGKLPFNVLSRLGSGRGALNRYGAASKSIWVTEFGWATGGSYSGWTVSPQQQQRNLDDMYRKFFEVARSYRLLGATWFSYRDHRPAPGEPDYWGYRSGLLDFYRNPKPAWTTFSRRARSGF